MPSKIRVWDVKLSYEEYHYRTPIKFGGVALNRVTILNAKVLVEDQQGKKATGYGSMPLGNVWAFPSKKMDYSQTLRAMQEVVGKCAEITTTTDVPGHPIEINHHLEAKYLEAAKMLSSNLAEPIPKLATLVAASPIDAAIHDAYGRLHQRSSYETIDQEFLPKAIEAFLDSDFKDVWLSDHISVEPRPQLPLYHLIGALDPLVPHDVKNPIGDSLPEHLDEWIARDRLTHLKIKLNGDDLAWDVDRVVAVEKIAAEAQGKRGCTNWHYSLDFNEKCQNVDYLLEFIRRVQEESPNAWQRVQYIEQPTARDLQAHPENKMHAVSKLVPVVIDESLTDVESLLLAREQGYTGVALKACKGISQSLLLAAAARHLGMFLCVQDLTCPGASLILSAGLAAHVKGVAAIEANSRQYIPAANERWKAKYPGLFEPVDGMLLTGQLDKVGLSLDAELMDCGHDGNEK
jgi:L-alanine-DL-glutamate epimerase-like enolase superfamily enzyme